MGKANNSIHQHQPLRVPKGWGTEERRFVMQLEEVLDEIFSWKNRIHLSDLGGDVRKELTTTDDEGNVVTISQKVTETAGKISSLMEQTTHFDDGIEEAKTSYEKTAKGMEQLVSTVKTSTTTLEKSADELRKQSEAAETKLTEAQTDFNTNMKKMSDQTDLLTKTAGELVASAESVEGQVTVTQQKLEEAQTKFSQTSDEIGALAKKTEKLTEEATGYRTSADGMAQEVKVTQKKLTEAETAFNLSADGLKTLSTKTEELTTQAQGLTEAASGAEKAATEAQTKLTEYQTSLETSAKGVQTLVQETQKLYDQTTKSETQLGVVATGIEACVTREDYEADNEARFDENGNAKSANQVLTTRASMTADGVKVQSGGYIQLDAADGDNSYISLGDMFSASKEGGVVSDKGVFKELRAEGGRVLTESDVPVKIVFAAERPDGHDILWLCPGTAAPDPSTPEPVTPAEETTMTKQYSGSSNVRFTTSSRSATIPMSSGETRKLPDNAAYSYSISIELTSSCHNPLDMTFNVSSAFGNHGRRSFTIDSFGSYTLSIQGNSETNPDTAGQNSVYLSLMNNIEVQSPANGVRVLGASMRVKSSSTTGGGLISRGENGEIEEVVSDPVVCTVRYIP